MRGVNIDLKAEAAVQHLYTMLSNELVVGCSRW